MNTTLKTLTAFALGALAMYYADPRMGRRRRAMMRDKAVAAGHDAEGFARAKLKRTADRMTGALAKTRARITPEQLDDDRLHERVRARLGRAVSHPRAIEIEVQDGQVRLSGEVPAEEVQELVSAVGSVRGVKDVENRLTVVPAHAQPGMGGAQQDAQPGMPH